MSEIAQANWLPKSWQGDAFRDIDARLDALEEGGGGGGGITESHVSVTNRDPGLDIPADTGANPFVQLGSAGYYNGYAGYVEDEDQVITVVGDDFTLNTGDYDDTHYGAFSLPVDVGGLISMSLYARIIDQSTGLNAVNPTIYASLETYPMPTFSGELVRDVASVRPGETGGQVVINATVNEWMMPPSGESLWFGCWIQNNHTTQDIRLYYHYTLTLMQRKEA